MGKGLDVKCIIAGSRDITDVKLVHAAIKETRDIHGIKISEVVSGGAAGVDYIGETLAIMHGMPVKVFPADWKTHGKAAGPIRNRQMAEYAGALIAITNGSRGTKNMIEEMKKLGKPVFVYEVNKIV